MRWLRYGWHIAVNCFALFIVISVLDKFYNRSEGVIVAILGLIYVSIRQVGIGMGFAYGHSLSHLNKQFVRIRERLNDPPSDAERKEMKTLDESQTRGLGRMIIDSVFLAIIFLLCLWALWIDL